MSARFFIVPGSKIEVAVQPCRRRHTESSWWVLRGAIVLSLSKLLKVASYDISSLCRFLLIELTRILETDHGIRSLLRQCLIGMD